MTDIKEITEQERHMKGVDTNTLHLCTTVLVFPYKAPHSRNRHCILLAGMGSAMSAPYQLQGKREQIEKN